VGGGVENFIIIVYCSIWVQVRVRGR